jgi:hypothetical protein
MKFLTPVNVKNLTLFILRAKMLSKSDPRSERGYSMLIVSIILIILLSMMAAYLTLADQTKKRTAGLSNGTRPWVGGNVNQGSGNMYGAATTTVDTAFLSYTDKSTGNLGVGRGYNGGAGPKVYSGGLNNYMRMIEDWGGVTFNYSGSFISLGYPIEFGGAYVAGGNAASYYNIPIGNFAYDTNFNAFDKLPPMTPRVIYLQQEVFKRSF